MIDGTTMNMLKMLCENSDLTIYYKDMIKEVMNEIKMTTIFKNKANEKSREPHLIDLTIKIGFDSLEEYQQFEEWLKNG